MPLNPATFPRPPLLEQISRRLQVKWPSGETIADTTRGYWVLETHHAPTYYIPPTDIHLPLTPTPRRTFCEWKGPARYFALTAPDGSTVSNRAWAYENPTAGFAPIKDYVSFYAGPWECFVDGERVEPQPGDFYGGWVTQEVVGEVKGAPGTGWW